MKKEKNDGIMILHFVILLFSILLFCGSLLARSAQASPTSCFL
ncbi:MAG: hypothetical protein Q7J98_14560 [Kiritimatiellia bacterium]|nr:hypothetical protein [Kiritimatiellia bacterium]